MRPRPHVPRRRRAAARALPLVGAALTVAALMAGASALGSTSGGLESHISAAREREGELRAGLGADARQIEGFRGHIADLQARLSALEASLSVEREVLARLRSQLASARARLSALQVELTRDRRLLVAQVVAAYETPPPDIATVVLQAHGFADLIERVQDLQAISRQNADATTQTAREQRLVSAQANRLALLESSHAREASAMAVQRDEVAQLRLALIRRQLEFIRARDRKSAELGSLEAHKRSLEQELDRLAASELAAQGVAGAYTGPVGEFTPAPQGSSGFFPAAGTNYSVGEEPTLASHLNALGIALHIHLIGISGYRSPQHSVEVGGFADDPHTRGEASDTPGVEGVPQATLARFGLIRPFPGAAEADHIQLLGSRY